MSSRLLSENVKFRTYNTIILPVILYGYETWSQTLREEHRLRVLRRIFVPKRDEMTGGLRKLHNELHKLYCSPSMIRMIKSRWMRCVGNVARMEEKRNAYRILVEKPEGNRPLGRPRRRWIDNSKMDLRGIGCSGMYWLRIGTSGGLL
jgi:hypothetical protein